jgi:hypothetical protein
MVGVSALAKKLETGCPVEITTMNEAPPRSYVVSMIQRTVLYGIVLQFTEIITVGVMEKIIVLFKYHGYQRLATTLFIFLELTT